MCCCHFDGMICLNVESNYYGKDCGEYDCEFNEDEVII